MLFYSILIVHMVTLSHTFVTKKTPKHNFYLILVSKIYIIWQKGSNLLCVHQSFSCEPVILPAPFFVLHICQPLSLWT